ncbi:hypothetical protein [Aquimarina agarilytica]|uniref:hypothetical protein n=1 Tax=Aquimarina agarilytica TaxID=1087449 RepID=UPI000314B5C5|nr:hypothetical protein [Aquimarina agarilytica]
MEIPIPNGLVTAGLSYGIRVFTRYFWFVEGFCMALLLFMGTSIFIGSKNT